MKWFWLLLGLLPSAWAAGSASELAQELQAASFDINECYRVRDLSFSKEDLRFSLTDGYLLFAKPVRGQRLAAAFVTDVEGGDGELLVMPPHRGERQSLAQFTDSPTLNEHLNSALFFFADDTGEQLRSRILASDPVKRSPERGALLAPQWDSILRNLTASFSFRLVQDLLSTKRAQRGVFYAVLSGRTLGNFDAIYDPRAREQILIGKTANRQGRSVFDIWTNFPSRSSRQAPTPVVSTDALTNYRIEAVLGADLGLQVTTRVTLTPSGQHDGVLAFELGRQLRVVNVTIDGQPAEFFQRESLRANLIRARENDVFLVLPPQPLQPGKAYQMEFHHEGNVITPAGNDVFFVAARTNWYPRQALDFTTYEVTFRYPKRLDLVSTGDIVEDRTEGEVRITKRRTPAPVRMVGFNLGHYQKAAVTRAGLTVECYANRALESALQPKLDVVLPPPPPPFSRQRRAMDLTLPPTTTPFTPASRVQVLANEIAAAYQFMAGLFGPPPLRTLMVSPIPGTFGQGFPGLVYLSTLSYLEPLTMRNDQQKVFFSDLLHAHEAAHQWWGNLVTPASTQDEWLMESLANYSALLYLEKRRGPGAVDGVLAEYRDHLLKNGEDGRTLEAHGPIIWGTRLQQSGTPEAWRAITYEKGSWIMQMLRRRLGDERFLAMLSALRQRYERQAISTAQFQALVREFLPAGSPDRKLDSFFEQWVYGTGVPKLKLQSQVRGTAPKVRVTGTLTQTEVTDDFGALVPVEVQLARGRSVTQWVETSSEPVPFSVTVPSPPVRVAIDERGVLARK